jgi:hypothetical protein
MSKCLFCKTEGIFYTKEHIVPESLGNDTDIVEGMICDQCQNYLGRAVEKPALEKTPIAFWRSYLGTRTKKGCLPSVQLDPSAKGAIPSSHYMTDMGVGFTAHSDGSTSIDVDNSTFMQKLLSREKGELRLVLSPWHLIILGRFLGKIGLEYLALASLDEALTNVFNPIRSFVRYGSTNYMWPIFWGQQGKLRDLKGPIVWSGWEGYQESECYRYALGRTTKSEILFVFSIGIDLMLICLSHRLPNPNLKKAIEGIALSCVYYEDGTW